MADQETKQLDNNSPTGMGRLLSKPPQLENQSSSEVTNTQDSGSLVKGAKTLIIAPHPDDEVLGCATYLKPSTFVLYMTCNHPNVDRDVLMDEMESVKTATGIETDLNTPTLIHTNVLDQDYQSNMISDLTKVINQLAPKTVLIPNPSYNQDHRAVYTAALTAMRRHDKNHFVPRVLAYESPESIDLRPTQPFNPTYFRHMTSDAMHRKIDLYQMYKSQVRMHRSIKMMFSLAEMRGMCANCEYAEAFEVLRWVK